jgi:malate dehydrogenase (oxaloacetate-decarboxylating)
MISRAREVTDGMFAAAAHQLAHEVSSDDLQAGSLFPPTGQIRRVTKAVAAAVIRAAQEEGLANRVLAEADIPGAVAAAMWDPVYLPMDPTLLDQAEAGPRLARHL